MIPLNRFHGMCRISLTLILVVVLNAQTVKAQQLLGIIVDESSGEKTFLTHKKPADIDRNNSSIYQLISDSNDTDRNKLKNAIQALREERTQRGKVDSDVANNKTGETSTADHSEKAEVSNIDPFKLISLSSSFFNHTDKHKSAYDEEPGVVYGVTNNEDIWAENTEGWANKWTARVGLLYMTREKPSSVGIYQQPVGNVLINSNQLNFDYKPGVDALLIKNITEKYSIYGRYLWIGDLSASSGGFVGSNYFVGTSPPTDFGGGDFGTDRTFFIRDELQSAEIGLRKEICCPWLYLSAGFRWMELDEQLYDSGIADDDPPSFILGVLDYRTQNDLWGFQIGADGSIPVRGSWYLDYFANVGVYQNNARVAGSYDSGSGISTIQGSKNLTALISELGLGVLYQLTDNVAFRVGYRVMWLDGVALAPDQLLNTPPFSGSSATIPVDTGTLFLHGADFTLEVRF